MHHGLANALLLPAGISFIEASDLNTDQRSRIDRVRSLFKNRGITGSLADCCRRFVESLGIKLGLSGHGVLESDLEALSREALEDPCHQANMIPVGLDDLLSVYRASF
jgi:alcohol dehydrogenase class IV